VTREKLLKHAGRYGTEHVLEAAVELRLPLEELVRLQEGLDEIDSKQRGYRKPRKTAEERVKQFLGIEEEASAE